MACALFSPLAMLESEIEGEASHMNLVEFEKENNEFIQHLLQGFASCPVFSQTYFDAALVPCGAKIEELPLPHIFCVGFIAAHLLVYNDDDEQQLKCNLLNGLSCSLSPDMTALHFDAAMTPANTPRSIRILRNFLVPIDDGAGDGAKESPKRTMRVLLIDEVLFRSSKRRAVMQPRNNHDNVVVAAAKAPSTALWLLDSVGTFLSTIPHYVWQSMPQASTIAALPSWPPRWWSETAQQEGVVGSVQEAASNDNIIAAVIDFTQQQQQNSAEDAKSKPFPPENISSFLDLIVGRMAQSELWKDHIEDSRKGLEAFIIQKLYDRCFIAGIEVTSKDAYLLQKLASAQKAHGVQSTAIGVDAAIVRTADWGTAVTALRRINEFKIPQMKLNCIAECLDAIVRAVHAAAAQQQPYEGNCSGQGDSDDPPGPEILFSCFIFCMCHANPPKLASNAEFIQRFTFDKKRGLHGAAGYCLATLQAAIQFWVSCKDSDFKLSEGTLPSFNSPSSSSS